MSLFQKYFVFIVFLSQLLFSGFYFRNESDSIKRDNPTDQKAADYQGYESYDTDGDGIADFSILLNNGVTNCASRDVNLNVTGPHCEKIYISEDAVKRAFKDFTSKYRATNHLREVPHGLE